MSARQARSLIPALALVCFVLLVSMQGSQDKSQEKSVKKKRGAITGVRRGAGPEPYQLGNRELPDLSRIFEEKTAVMIPMRDGIKLYTEIYHPKGFTEPLPIILERTPYQANPGYQKYSPRLSYYTEFFEEGYIFALQDLRGRLKSEGEHVALRPQRDPNDPDGIDESTDFYDTIEWLVNNVPNTNGRVGTLGISYGGFLSTRAMIDPHPALRAVSPQATCADMFIGDDFHHNGAFRLSYAFAAAVGLDTWKSPLGLYIDKRDEYEWFLEVGPLSNINDKYLHGISPTWNAFVEHPNLDDTWRCGICGVLPHVNEVTVPALHVTGWYDPEDFYGPIQVYKKLEKKDARDQNFLVLGPWYHGGWTFEETGRTLGPLDLGTDTARHFRDEIHVKWFTYWLKDKGELPLGEALTYQMGSNEWQHYEEWPPKEGIEFRNLYLHPSGHLSFEPPKSDNKEDFDSYISDPANPVPFRFRPYLYPWGWQEWTLEDQRFVHRRTDVLSWVSEPLEEDLSITGEPIARLFASTSGEDCDWVVKLIDVFPEKHKVWDMRGYQMIVGAEVFRARFRNSFEVPEPVAPNKVTEYTISLRDRNHRFLKGHRIMVQIQSSWFPLIDRNP
ncbi:CocE/NonD family hydrolase, partial [Acidobacteriota bacterium]